MKATSRECDSLLAKWLDKHRVRRSSREGEGRKEDFMDVMLLIIEDGQISGYDHDTIIKATRLAWFLDTDKGTLDIKVESKAEYENDRNPQHFLTEWSFL